MYSLENAYSLEEIEDFYEKLKKNDNSIINFVAEMKLDGFSINLYYENGILQYATTRGDGFEGEDVTENVKTINSLPINIDYLEPIEIRGEISYQELILKESILKETKMVKSFLQILVMLLLEQLN